MDAFRQKIDFCNKDVLSEIKLGSDIDFSYELLNGRMAAIEVKKDTPRHAIKTIINSKQWEHYRKLCRDNTFLIYATHDCDISLNEDIPMDALTVRYIEENNQELKLSAPMSLKAVLKYLSSLNMYYVKVRYSNTIEYALKSPIEGKWSSIEYNGGAILFSTEAFARQFIDIRYRKSFNQKYIYEIWYVDSNGKHNKIADVKYIANV
jgi:hypothetical protein